MHDDAFCSAKRNSLLKHWKAIWLNKMKNSLGPIPIMKYFERFKNCRNQLHLFVCHVLLWWQMQLGKSESFIFLIVTIETILNNSACTMDKECWVWIINKIFAKHQSWQLSDLGIKEKQCKKWQFSSERSSKSNKVVEYTNRWLIRSTCNRFSSKIYGFVPKRYVHSTLLSWTVK